MVRKMFEKCSNFENSLSEPTEPKVCQKSSADSSANRLVGRGLMLAYLLKLMHIL